jgi:hypothetical protein
MWCGKMDARHLPEHIRKILSGDCEGCERRREKLKVTFEKLTALMRSGPPNPLAIAALMRQMAADASPEAEIEASLNITKKNTDA